MPLQEKKYPNVQTSGAQCPKNFLSLWLPLHFIVENWLALTFFLKYTVALLFVAITRKPTKNLFLKIG